MASPRTRPQVPQSPSRFWSGQPPAKLLPFSMKANALTHPPTLGPVALQRQQMIRQLPVELPPSGCRPAQPRAALFSPSPVPSCLPHCIPSGLVHCQVKNTVPQVQDHRLPPHTSVRQVPCPGQTAPSHTQKRTITERCRHREHTRHVTGYMRSQSDMSAVKQEQTQHGVSRRQKGNLDL